MYKSHFDIEESKQQIYNDIEIEFTDFEEESAVIPHDLLENLQKQEVLFEKDNLIDDI